MLTDDFLDKRLYRAYFKAQKGKQQTKNEHDFEINFVENLSILREDIKQRTYEPSRGIAFINHSPVDREIFAAPFRDRIIHHFICDFIVDWWEKRFIDASYSCRVGKGTDAGIRDLYRKIRKVSKNFHEPTVVVKIDMSSYFCSIPHQKLFDRVHWGLKRQFMHEDHTIEEEEIYKMLRFLCHQVIFDNPTIGVKKIGDAKAWETYPKRKSLFYQKPGRGIVIGNLTSQVFSNIYLDQLDRFAIFTLGEKNYGRYVDDAFFVIPEKEQEYFMKNKMPALLDFATGMNLIVNPKKTFCQNIDKGIPFLGAIVYPYHILPDERIKRNFRKSLKEYQMHGGDLSGIISYLGRLKHMDAMRFVKESFLELGLDYQYEKKGSIGGHYYTDEKNYIYNKMRRFK